jgi:hypothetical protein
MAENDTDAARLTLDREKWEGDRALRERELALKEREIGLKEHEQKISSWTNPLTVAIAVAALAWVGNVIATWWNGRLQDVLEKEKARQTLQLEESKAESERILEMIKTGDPGKAVINLKFLLDAGLVASPERVAKLRDYLEKTPAASGPALPAAGARFSIEQSDALPVSASAMLDRNLNDFIAYLDKAGFETKTEHARVSVKKLPSPNAYYDGEEKTIVIDPAIVGDAYVAHREYMHHLLFASKPGNEWASPIGGLENGIADYFSASFSDNPVLGTVQSARTLGIDHSYIRRLDNNLRYTKYRPGEQPHEYGEMWGGAFWDIRKALGAGPTDRMLALAWQSMSWPLDEPQVVVGFIKSLSDAAGKVGGEAAVKKVRALLRARNVPL